MDMVIGVKEEHFMLIAMLLCARVLMNSVVVVLLGVID